VLSRPAFGQKWENIGQAALDGKSGHAVARTSRILTHEADFALAACLFSGIIQQ
jgi:hypothetical protein